jgi:hypothetical protein
VTRAQNLVRWLWLPVLLAFAYSGWVIYSRRAQNREIERQAEMDKAKSDQKILDQVGGDELKVLMFYANPPLVRKGERGLLCYGVSNAKTVMIEPPVDGVGPALSRCVEVRPTRDTEYTLTAKDDKGREVSQTVPVKVQ